MMHTHRALLVALTVSLLLVGVVGLGFAQPVTITVWDAIPASSRATFVGIVDEFNDKHPNIRVELENVPGGYQGVTEKMVIALAAGIPPNIVHTAHVQAYSFRYMGVFMSLNPYIDNDPAFDLDDWYPPFIETVSIGDQIYGIPYNVSTPLTYFSPQLLEESGLAPRPPATWDEMVAMGPRVTRDYSGDGIPAIWAMDTIRSSGWLMEAYLGQAGGRTMNADNTELMLNSPEGVRAWQFQQDLIHKHRISRYPGAPRTELDTAKVGWWYRSTASLAGYIESTTASGYPIKVAPLPCDVQCYAPIGGGALYAVDTGSQAERDASYTFLKFLAEPENLARYAAASGYMAGRKSAVGESYLRDVFAQHPIYMVTYEQLAVAHPETQAPEWAKIQQLWEDRPTFLDPIFQDGMPVQPVLDDLVRRGNAIISEFYAAYGR